MGLQQKVVDLPDDLSLGPIIRLDHGERRRWAKANLRPLSGYWPTREDIRRFWSFTLAAEEIIVWTTRRVPNEYCGFLCWIERARDKPYKVVDLTDTVFGEDRELMFSLAHVNPEFVDYKSQLAAAAPLGAKAREDYRRMWKELRRQNADLRIISNSQLVSAPINVFDKQVLSGVSETWRPAVRVAGDASVPLWTDAERQGEMAFLLGRLAALIASGSIEARGDLDGDWRSVEARLAARGYGAHS